MGSLVVVLLFLAAGVLAGRIAGPSLTARALLALAATVIISMGFLGWIMLANL